VHGQAKGLQYELDAAKASIADLAAHEEALSQQLKAAQVLL
jgi:hypothetical protein